MRVLLRVQHAAPQGAADLWATAFSADLRILVFCCCVRMFGVVRLWACGLVGVEVCWFVGKCFVCLCVCVIVCLWFVRVFACCVCLCAVCFCVTMCDYTFVDLWFCWCLCVDVFCSGFVC